MAKVKRTVIFGKLNPIAYKSIESATVFCKMRGNPYVELVHWLYQILNQDDSDLHQILRALEVDTSRVATELTRALDMLPRGATAISDFSPHIESAVREAWLVASLQFQVSAIRTGHLLIALLRSEGLQPVLARCSETIGSINADTLTEQFDKLTEASPEAQQQASEQNRLSGDVEPGQSSEAMAPAAMGRGEALKQFTIDLTERARSGEMDPIVGRDNEIRQIIDILMRRRQNNPILTGEAGVGKTAVVEGFAQRIAANDVPPSLRGVTLRSLDIGLLEAGASMKGEFENRLKQLIEEVQSSDEPIILFIDEAHTLIGAGGAAGQNDAANLLKPALARGTLRTIAATTWAEYKKYFEKDPALTRRFQNILVDEPSDEQAMRMMRSLSGMLEKHHKVQILDEALEAAVTLSRRYIPSRQLPDKAVSVLDTACARVAVSQHGEPPALEDCRRKIEAMELEVEILDREETLGLEHEKRKAELATELEQAHTERVELEARWKQEAELIHRILELRSKLRENFGKVEGTGSDLEAKVEEAESETPGADTAAAEEADTEPSAAASEVEVATEPEATDAEPEMDREQMMAALYALQDELKPIQGEHPMVLPAVDEIAVGSVIGDWTGIPVGRMVKNEIEAVMHLTDRLRERVIGQDLALGSVAERIQTARASLSDPNKPIAVMMFAGPSGVGKTETALALAETLYGGEQNLITINMSEFQEAHTVSTLKGAPPGYVGYGEGGVLTEAVRRKPYSVVLLDEVEKAHKDVHEIFFQVFDKGRMEDGEGRLIDFRNTVILLTTNVGTEMITKMCQDPDLMPDMEGLQQALREPLLQTFPAALLGRIFVVPYYPLDHEALDQIARLKLHKITKRVAANYGVSLEFDSSVFDLIRSRATELESGARMIDAIIAHHMLPQISRQYLNAMLEGVQPYSICVKVDNDKFTYERLGDSCEASE